MEFLIRKRVLQCLLLVSCFFSASCAKNFNSVISAPAPLEKEKIFGQSFLDGAFALEDGSLQELALLNDKPALIFFVGEFCGDCIDETKELKSLVLKKGLPTKMHLITIMTSEGPGVVADWFAEKDPTQAPSWILGSDQHLGLYYRYFETFNTPSVMFFDPQTQVLKRWQKSMTTPKTPLSDILDEVKPWD